MIKLINLVRESSDPSKGAYDITLSSKSGNIDSIKDALSDMGNYGIYLSNLINTNPRVKELVAKEFSPSGGPNMKIAKAAAMWNKGSAKFRTEKSAILKQRLNDKGIEFEDWDANRAISFKALPREARRMDIFFIPKNKTAMDDFIKTIAKDIGILSYNEENGVLVFPLEKNPKKDVTKKIIKTVMKNAGISDYSIGQFESGMTPTSKDSPTKKNVPSTLTTSLSDESDAKDLEKLLKNNLPIPAAKYNIESNEDEDGIETHKLVITNITPAQRAKLQSLSTSFTQDLMENSNRMLKIAGLKK